MKCTTILIPLASFPKEQKKLEKDIVKFFEISKTRKKTGKA